MIIVQARMGSARLPGKSLIKIKDKTVLEHTLEGILSIFDKNMLIVATSKSLDCKPLYELCEKHSIRYYAGDETNVASRFLEIIKQEDLSFFVRVSADSPLIDAASISEAIYKFKVSDGDLVTSKGGGFPSGMNVEVVNADTFRAAYPQFSKPEHFEHVTSYFYENSQKFNIKVLDCPVEGVQNLKFSLDTKEDLEKINKMFLKFEKPHYAYSLSEKLKIGAHLD